MKTYSEIENKEPFNWNKFLTQEIITDDEWDKAENLAESWVTCACGNQCSIIPRGEQGVPDDFVLTKIGGDNGFLSAIERRDANDALNILDLIEIRSKYLIDKELQRRKEEYFQGLVEAGVNL